MSNDSQSSNDPQTRSLSADRQILQQVLNEQATQLKFGKCRSAEDYFEQFPSLATNPEWAVDVIYHEYLVRQDAGQVTNPAEYLERFPEFAEALSAQFQIGGELIPDTNISGWEATGKSEIIPWMLLPKRYEFHERIGEGGFAFVYRATDSQLKRQVAIKIAKFACDTDSRLDKRFAREASAAASLAHPGIVSIFDYGIAHHRPYIVQPFISGGTLEASCKQGPVPVMKAAQWMAEICEAIDYAHRCNVIHRDVKPSNVLFDASSHPLLTDFGLAALSEGGFTITRDGELLGTPAYMSPEQARCDSDVTSATDIFSAGVVLYQLLCGRLPFQGSMASIARQIIEAQPTLPRQIVPQIPTDLQTICLKAIEKQPGDRYASAREMADDLHRFLHNEPIRARPISTSERVARFVRRYPLVSLLTFLLVLLLCFVLGGILQYQAVVQQRNLAKSAEAETSELLAEKAASAGYLAMQRGQTEIAKQHFLDALQRDYFDARGVKLSLVRCDIIHGELENAAKTLETLDPNDNDQQVLLLKTRLSLLGVSHNQSSRELLDAINVERLAPADAHYVAGLRATESRAALAHFEAALAANPYHHGARRLANVMALSLADFEYVGELASISSQLYPDDDEFPLIEALGRAAQGQISQSQTLIESTNLPPAQQQAWLQLAEFARYVCCDLRTGGDRIFSAESPDSGLTYTDFIDLLRSFQLDYAGLIQSRQWFLPPAIAERFVDFLQSNASSSAAQEEEVQRIELGLAEAHSEATLLTAIARRLVEADKTDLETVQRIQDYYERAADSTGFLRDTSDHAKQGAFAAAIHLAVVHNFDTSKNVGRALSLLDQIEPATCDSLPNLRVMTIYPFQQGHYKLAEKYAERWHEVAVVENDRQAIRDSQWHRALIAEQDQAWYRVVRICDQLSELSGTAEEKSAVTQLRDAAIESLKQQISDL